MKGKIRLPALGEPPEPLCGLLTSNECTAVKFWEDMWKYNQAFAFTSLGVQEDHSVNQDRGPPVFRISGELHYWSGALVPAEDQLPCYAQLYMYEPQAALDAHMNQNEGLDC